MIHPNLVVKKSHSSFDILLDPAPTMTRNPIKTPWPEPSHGQQKGRPKKGQEEAKLRGIEERKELVLLMVGNYFTHSPSKVTSMQIMSSNSNRMFRTSISHQCNFPLYSGG